MVVVMLRSLFATLVLASGAAHADDALPRSGALHQGASVDLIELGPVEVHATGGSGIGIRLAVGGEYELDAHWAIRVPIVVAVTGSGSAHENGFAELDVVPGVVYRFRSTGLETWVPYLGGGVKLGAWGADRPLVGQPLVAARTAPDLEDLFGDHHHTGDGSGGDPNFDVKAGAGIELWAGTEVHAASWLGIRFGLALGLVRVDRTLIETIAETVTLRVSI
jgi:hypothetical protein